MGTSSNSKNTKNKSASKKSSKPAEVTGFLSHLIEMRDRLLRAVIVVSIAFIALFPFAKDIYNWLAAPLINQGQVMIITGTVAPFLIPMKLTLLVAFLIALPYLLYQLWSFVAPGLYKHERRLVYPLLASSVFLFYLGIMFVYYVLLPMMFKVIPQFAPDVATYSPDIAQYLDFTMMMFLAFGFGFEMPIATILLISTGITTAESLREKRPYVIVAAFVIGMLLTPPDVISQIMLAIPMWILFELGLIFSKFFKTRIKEAGEARHELDKYLENEPDNNSNKTDKSTATGTSAALAAEKLWEDDNYIFEEDDENETSDDDTPASDLSDEEKSILDKDPLDESLYDEDYLPEEDVNTSEDKDDKFFDNEDFHEMTDEEMEAEMDRIEAEELAEKIVEKKAKKRAKDKIKKGKKKSKKKNNNDPKNEK